METLEKLIKKRTKLVDERTTLLIRHTTLIKELQKDAPTIENLHNTLYYKIHPLRSEIESIQEKVIKINRSLKKLK